MKRFYLILPICLLLVSWICFAQVPAQLNYQAVARNAAGLPLVNQSIVTRLTIHAETPNGAIRYSETRTVTTNGFGMFTVAIGSDGAVNVTGNISTIDFYFAAHFLQVELDVNNSNNFLNMGTTQLLSVPYALQAQRSNTADQLKLPFGATVNSQFPLVNLKNTGNGNAMLLEIANQQTISNVLEVTTNSVNAGGAIYARKGLSGAVIPIKGAITGEAGNSDIAIAGYADEDFGIYGHSKESDAIYGLSASGGKAGIVGTTNHAIGDGVVGRATAGHGVTGVATSGWGGHFSATTGKALFTSGQIQMDNTGQSTGKTLMTDGSGNAHWEGGIAFSVQGIANQLNVPDGTQVPVPYTTIDYNLGNHYHNSADPVSPNTFIAPVNGIYHFDAGVLWAEFTNVIGTAGIYFRVNGSVKIYNKLAAYGELQTTNISGDLLLNAGDKVTVVVFQTSNVTQKIWNSTGNYFSGRFVMKN